MCCGMTHWRQQVQSVLARVSETLNFFSCFNCLSRKTLSLFENQQWTTDGMTFSGAKCKKKKGFRSMCAFFVLEERVSLHIYFLINVYLINFWFKTWRKIYIHQVSEMPTALVFSYTTDLVVEDTTDWTLIELIINVYF